MMSIVIEKRHGNKIYMHPFFLPWAFSQIRLRLLLHRQTRQSHHRPLPNDKFNISMYIFDHIIFKYKHSILPSSWALPSSQLSWKPF